MNNKSCTNGKHKYGLWNIDKNKSFVYRTCDNCSYKLSLPITEEVIIEITKQEEASKIFRAFQLVSDTDENLINYIELILEDYINYLNKEDYFKFVKRIKMLDDKNILDSKSILFLHKLDIYLDVDNNLNSNYLNIKEDSELAYEQ